MTQKKVKLELVNPPVTTRVDQIMRRSEVFFQMVKYMSPTDCKYLYQWQIVNRKNGKPLRIEHLYQNKAQCRNIGKRYAEMFGVEWRE